MLGPADLLDAPVRVGVKQLDHRAMQVVGLDLLGPAAPLGRRRSLSAPLLALVLAEAIQHGDLFGADSGSQVAQRGFDGGKARGDAEAMPPAALGVGGGRW